MVRQDLTGKFFSNMEVLEYFENYISISKSGRKTSRPMWLCLCSCGQLVLKSSTDLKGRNLNLCKYCAYATRKQSIQRLTPTQRHYNLVIKNRKKIKNNLTLKEFEEIVGKNCYYCDEPPTKKAHIYGHNIHTQYDYYANGVDRIDSNKGYEKNNCVPCCKTCNFMKNTLSLDEFINKCITISKKFNRGE